MKIIKPSVEIIDELNQDAILKKIEMCARVCYKSEDKATDESAEKFIRSIIKRGHESVLEHVSFTVRFVVDRAIANEIVRHRLTSPSQESTRYIRYDSIGFVKPIELKQDSIWKDACESSERFYSMLIQSGEKPETARSVLLHGTKTELILTSNAREWRHVIKLRTSPAAHTDMRHIMNKLLDELLVELPVLFDDIRS